MKPNGGNNSDAHYAFACCIRCNKGNLLRRWFYARIACRREMNALTYLRGKWCYFTIAMRLVEITYSRPRDYNISRAIKAAREMIVSFSGININSLGQRMSFRSAPNLLYFRELLYNSFFSAYIDWNVLINYVVFRKIYIYLFFFQIERGLDCLRICPWNTCQR